MLIVLMKLLFPFLLLLCLFNTANASALYEWHNKYKFTKSEQTQIDQWLANGVTASQQTFSLLPFQTLRFNVSPQPNAREPVPWGQVDRDGNIIVLKIDTKFPTKSFIDDWTLYHEIAHLYLPFLDDSSIWLSEGFATYVQQIIMLDNDVFDKDTFVRRIKAGFSRGIKNTAKQRGPLSSVSNNMWSRRAYMRVYWSGTAYFLEVDSLLQEQGSDLIEVIKQYVSCCLTSDAYGSELIKTLDQISNSDAFSTLYHQYKYRQDFPDIGSKAIIKIADYYERKQ
ncbi:hypothetical protein ACFSJY_01220 [Thalassotalea euphylliae]|uniref:M61 family metallopeptidase n=1 Tax=Thalassotalea euphylliae TaxID=1655234 RepID=UPI00363B0976